MSFGELFLIAVGLSMDAFAAAVCIGLAIPKATLKRAVIVGLYFGIFQGLMPLTGWMLATRFTDKIIAFDHWVAFVLLGIIGGRMIIESFSKESEPDKESHAGACADETCRNGVRLKVEQASLGPARMLTLAVATSVDALAVGVSLAFLRVRIVHAVSFIGIITFILSMLGVKAGNMFGMRFKSKAEFAGGVILVLIGCKILLEHLGVIVF